MGEDDVPMVNFDLCFGCAVCATGCEDEAISMVNKPDFRGVPQDGKALKEGDAFKATGNLPTKTVFNSDSVGGFIGLTVTSEALKALMD